MRYEHRPKVIEAFKVIHVGWDTERGYIVKFEDGTTQFLPSRSCVPCLGDYWTVEGFKNGTDFELEYRPAMYPHEMVVGGIS